jgi:hypothetical protein
VAEEFIVGQHDARRVVRQLGHDDGGGLVEGLVHRRGEDLEGLAAALADAPVGQRDDPTEMIVHKADRHPLAAEPRGELGGQGRGRRPELVVGHQRRLKGDQINARRLGGRGLRGSSEHPS